MLKFNSLRGELLAAALISGTTLLLTGCSNVPIPEPVVTNVRPCLQATYDDDSALTLGIERIHWEDKLTKFDMTTGTANLPEAEKKALEQQNTWIPQDKFLVFNVYIENHGKQPLMWQPRKAPVFTLVDAAGTKWSPAGQAQGNMQDITAKVMMGQNINPNRKVMGSSIFDVPRSGTYTLVAKMGVWGGGWSVFGGSEIMRCKVVANETN